MFKTFGNEKRKVSWYTGEAAGSDEIHADTCDYLGIYFLKEKRGFEHI